MFFVSIISALILWLTFCRIYPLSGTAPGRAAAALLLAALGWLILAVVPIGLLVAEFFVWSAIGFISRLCGSSPRGFAIASAVVGVILFVALGRSGVDDWREAVKRVPLEPLSARLGYESRGRAGAEVLPDAGGLVKLDGRFQPDHAARLRTESVRLVYASGFEQFINGVWFSFGDWEVPRPYFPPRPAVQRLPTALPQWTGELALPLPEKLDPAIDRSWAETLHNNAVVAFVNMLGWGCVIDRGQVAGFRSHAIRDSFWPASDTVWEIERFELVSLLRGDPPAARYSGYFPRIDDLRETPTRPLDAFEVGGLQQIEHGDDIAIVTEENHVRMLGAIRAADKCLQCHEVQHGALLGAFSYVLIPAEMVQK